MSARELAMTGLREVLETATQLDVHRATDIPLSAQEASEVSQIWLGEGDAIIEPMFSPLLYSVTRTAEVRLLVTGADEAVRDAETDRLLGLIGSQFLGDRTLGGVVEFAELNPPIFDVSEANGAARVALLPVVLTYTTPDPAGA